MSISVTMAFCALYSEIILAAHMVVGSCRVPIRLWALAPSYRILGYEFLLCQIKDVLMWRLLTEAYLKQKQDVQIKTFKKYLQNFQIIILYFILLPLNLFSITFFSRIHLIYKRHYQLFFLIILFARPTDQRSTVVKTSLSISIDYFLNTFLTSEVISKQMFQSFPLFLDVSLIF